MSIEVPEKCCGTCNCHFIYKFPETIFCFIKYEKREHAIKHILDSCEDWTESLEYQDCLCLEEYIRARALQP